MLLCECGNPVEEGKTQCAACIAFTELEAHDYYLVTDDEEANYEYEDEGGFWDRY